MIGGSNPTLNSGIKQSGQIAGYGTSTGEGLTTSAGNFYQTLLGGDPSKTAKLLAPQLKTMQDQQQQQQKTSAEFGNRSGGTNAKNQTAGDTTRANYTDLVSKLTSGAAGGAAGLGKDLLSTGMDALKNQVAFSQQQMDNWQNSIFGQGMANAAGYAESTALAA